MKSLVLGKNRYEWDPIGSRAPFFSSLRLLASSAFDFVSVTMQRTTDCFYPLPCYNINFHNPPNLIISPRDSDDNACALRSEIIGNWHYLKEISLCILSQVLTRQSPHRQERIYHLEDLSHPTTCWQLEIFNQNYLAIIIIIYILTLRGTRNPQT
jgi:hypothetical protein